MMVKKTFALLLFGTMCILQNLYAQDTLTTFEKMSDGTTRFFYDENYYLVDKNCEFKHIERVSQFDDQQNIFAGSFKDFDRNGTLLLSGSYVGGLKHGDFKAYHPNGSLKWESTYINNKPIGEWKYYYPDGKPMLYIDITENSFSIMQMWDRYTNQTVKDGTGTYELTFPIIGFTEHGYTSYTRKGKVKKGKLHGTWPVVLHDAKRKDTFGKEIFRNGKLVNESIDRYKFSGFSDLVSLVPFSILPNDYFPRAEHLLSKACTFDEHTGFSLFVGQKTLKMLRQSQLRQFFETTVQYQVKVSKEGIPDTVQFTPIESLSQETNDKIRRALSQIYYYIPSYLNDAPIDDILTVTFDFLWTAEKRQLNNFRIERKDGH